MEKLLETGTSVVKFIDRTFNIHPDAYEIWAYLISLDTSVTFHFEISPDLIKEEHIHLLRTAPVGRIQFEVGIQSTNQEVLLSINRFIGFRKVLLKLHALVSLKNIHNHMDLIAGLPYDTKESFKESFNDVYTLKPDMLQLGFLKVIKGTPMERDAKKYGIVYSPYAPYEVLKTRWMDFSDLRSLHHTEEALERYYNSGRFKTTLSYVLGEEKDPFAFYEDLGRYTGEKYPGQSIGAKEQFLLLRDFSRKWLSIRSGSSQDVVLNELMKFDWLGGNKKQFVPGFLERKLPENNEEKRRISKALGVKVHVEIYSINILLYADKGIVDMNETPVYYDEINGQIIRI